MGMSPRFMRPLAGAPAAPTDPYFSSVTLLMHMDGSEGSTSFADSSSYGRAMTASGAEITENAGPFGGSAAYFDGNSQITTPDANELDFGTGDFTVECWVKLTDNSSTGFFGTGGGYGGWFFGHPGGEYPAGRIGFGRAGVAWDCIEQTGTRLPLNQWLHVAAARVGTDLRCFVDGVLLASSTSSASFNTQNGDLYIGSHGGFLYFSGYMDELRITKGIGRYAATFSPPTAAFPDQ